MGTVAILVLAAIVLIWQYAKRREARSIRKAIEGATIGLRPHVLAAQEQLGANTESFVLRPESIAYLSGFLVQICNLSGVSSGHGLVAFSVFDNLFSPYEMKVLSEFKSIASDAGKSRAYGDWTRRGGHDAIEFARTGEGPEGYYNVIMDLSEGKSASAA